MQPRLQNLHYKFLQDDALLDQILATHDISDIQHLPGYITNNVHKTWAQLRSSKFKIHLQRTEHKPFANEIIQK